MIGEFDIQLEQHVQSRSEPVVLKSKIESMEAELHFDISILKEGETDIQIENLVDLNKDRSVIKQNTRSVKLSACSCSVQLWA